MMRLRARMRRPAGEFIRARLRLTAWYAGLLIIVLGAVGVPAVVLVTERLDDQVDSALGDEVVAAAPLLGQIVGCGWFAAAGGAGGGDGRRGVGGGGGGA